MKAHDALNTFLYNPMITAYNSKMEGVNLSMTPPIRPYNFINDAMLILFDSIN